MVSKLVNLSRVIFKQLSLRGEEKPVPWMCVALPAIRVAMDHIAAFFDARIAALTGAGIKRNRLVLDPGMGFFLGAAPETSLSVLARFDELRLRFDLPVLLSVSRKSFLRALTGRGPGDVGAATLAAELAAAAGGADFIRTHEPRPLRDGLAVLAALKETARIR